jgi:hypothetical protein
VATELATNLLKHAGGGRMVINLVDRPDTGSDTPGTAVQFVSVDHGPGIADVPAALRDGYSTGPASLGAGLGTCRRIADDFDLHSTPGRGTVAVARVDRTPRRAPAPRSWPDRRAGGITVPPAQGEQSGDAWSLVRSGPRLTLMLADGLGHGPPAAEASTTAVRELRRAAQLPPAGILRHLDTALRSTRGAAVAVAQLVLDTGRLTFAGIGDIGARLRVDGTWRPLVSQPGIVGTHRPAPAPVRQWPRQRDSVLVLHSDGLPGRWTPPDDTELFSHDPAVVAAAILRDASSAARPVRDDTSVAVLTAGPRDRRL